jgi:AP-1 complex subunit gamma-1
MPVLDEATFSGRRAGSLPASVSTSGKSPLGIPNGVAKAAAPLVDLLDLGSDDTPAPTSSSNNFLQDLLGVDLSQPSAQPGAMQPSQAGADILMDLLSIGTPAPVQNGSANGDLLSIQDNNAPIAPSLTSPTAPSSMMDLLDGFGPTPPKSEDKSAAYPSIVAFESSSLKIEFNFTKQSENPQTTDIVANFINLTPNVYTEFLFQAAVPKFLQLHLDPASSNSLPANGNIKQTMRVTNSQKGKKPIVMRMRVGYKINGKDVLEEGQINNFPRGL